MVRNDYRRGVAAKCFVCRKPRCGNPLRARLTVPCPDCRKGGVRLCRQCCRRFKDKASPGQGRCFRCRRAFPGWGKLMAS